MKTPRGTSESSTTSDNTTEFIDIVKKYDVVYNTHNPDYKNVEVKMKVWSQIAEEIGLSVEASKRKWKNLRDSYTKYLRSFRIGTKTSKKYQYWAHADHMDFLKPYQGPGRNTNNNNKNEDDDNECDLGYQVLTKATTSSSDDDVKVTIAANTSQNSTTQNGSGIMLPVLTAGSSVTAAPTTVATTSTSIPSISASHAAASTLLTAPAVSTITTSTGTLMLPMPSLPTVPLPPQLASKPVLASIPAMPTSLPAQIFPMPQLTSTVKTAIPMPASSTASSVGCLIIEPQLFASADTFKKELNASNIGLFHSAIPTHVATTATPSGRIHPPLITKIRRVQPSPQTAAINLSFSATQPNNQPPPPKARKLSDKPPDIDVSAILQANRDLDANTLFFLSLARTVRSMPTKFQSIAKMRCMRIVSDIELELDNVTDCQGPPMDEHNNNATKYCSLDSPPPPPPEGTIITQIAASSVTDAPTEHFVYVMSPSRVESMIDISSDDEATINGN